MSRRVPRVAFETSGDVPVVKGRGLDKLVMAATVERGNAVIERVGAILNNPDSPDTTLRPTWRGPDGNMSLRYVSPQNSSRYSQRPLYTVNLELQQKNFAEMTIIGFILRTWPHGNPPASAMVNYDLGEEVEEEWKGYPEGFAYSSLDNALRPLGEEDIVIGQVTAPVDILEGKMVRDFALATAGPEFLRSRVDTVDARLSTVFST